MPNKKIYYNTKQELEGLKWTAKVIDFGVGLTVMAALNEVYSAASILRDYKKLYRFEVKRLCNIAVEQADLRRNEIKSKMKHVGFWSDYSDRVVDEAEPDITAFRIAIKQELDNAKIPNSDIISRIECARALLETSIVQFDSMTETAKNKYGRNFRKDFVEYRATDVFSSWSKMSDLLYKSYKLDLNTKNVIGMFEKMGRKFEQGDYIQACMTEAIRNNPDFIDNAIKVVE